MVPHDLTFSVIQCPAYIGMKVVKLSSRTMFCVYPGRQAWPL